MSLHKKKFLTYCCRHYDSCGREPGCSLLTGMGPRWRWAGSDAAACHAAVLKVSSFLLFLYFLIYEREVALFSMFLLHQVAGVK